MGWLESRLFAGEPLLEAVAAGRDHLTRHRNAHEPAVLRLQAALLRWDPGCLPEYGCDGTYGAETAAAVRRFTARSAGLAPVGDAGEAGARVVRQLDKIQQAFELSLDLEQRTKDLDAWLSVPVCGLEPLLSTSEVHVHRTADRAFAAFQAAVASSSGADGFVRIPVPYEDPRRPNLWLVHDGARLRAFCGGDGGLELSGPAAFDAYKGMPDVLPAADPGAGLQRVRVFSTAEEREGFLRYAILRAQRFVYVEDPPLADEGITRELADRLAAEALEAVIVVLPVAHSAETADRRQRFLDQLKPYADRVAVVDSGAGVSRTGLWIFDDCIASAGWMAFGDLIEPGVVTGLRTAEWNDRLGPFAIVANARPTDSLPYWRSLSTETADAERLVS